MWPMALCRQTRGSAGRRRKGATVANNRRGGRDEGSESSQLSHGRQDISGGSLEEQLARAQERLAFYEGFDRLIQDNIARSAELMREAMDLRERAQFEIAQGHAEAERRVQTEREKQRLVFTSLLDELGEVQQSADRVARRVSQALEEIEATPSGNALISANGEPGSIDQSEATSGDGVEPFIVAAPAVVEERGPVASTSADVADVHEEEVSAAALTIVEERSATAAGGVLAAAGTVPGEPGGRAEPGTSVDHTDSVQPAAVRSETTTSPSRAVEDPRRGPATGTPAHAEPGSGEGLRVVMVLVHGVPRAAAALSLQRHLAGLAHVDGVEAREYAEGILRLQVTARRPLDLQDLRSWDGGANLEPVHVQRDVVEVKLPGAETF